MYNFFKNITVGLGSALGVIALVLLLGVVGGALWLIFATLGVVGYGLIKVLGFILVGAATTIGLLWLLGWLTTRSMQ